MILSCPEMWVCILTESAPHEATKQVIQEESVSAGILGQTEEWYGGQVCYSAEGPNVQGKTDRHL